MKTIIDDLQVYFKAADRRPLKVEKTNIPSTYSVTFNMDLGQGLTVFEVTIGFKFDMSSFIAKYSQLFPDISAIDEALVLKGFLEYYKEVESTIFMTGSQGYEQMAQLFEKNRGRLRGGIYGV